jgi:hypothetical protein
MIVVFVLWICVMVSKVGWEEGGMDTYHCHIINNEWRMSLSSSFIVWLPRR